MRRLASILGRLAGGESTLCRRLSGSAVALAALVAPVGAAPPAPMADPTRPPSAMPQAMAVARGAQATALQRPATAQPAIEVHTPLVQSVQLSQQGPPTALIDGRLVRIGDDIGGATLVAIDASGVTLRGASGPERLWLLPGVMRRADPVPPIRMAGDPAPTEAAAATDNTQASAVRRLPLRVPPVAIAGRKP